jgi:predicted AAA+ superfamily ATPase
MFFRNIISELQDWSASEDRKPLILRGARQVGKTTAVELLSKEFDRYIYMNLEKHEDANIFKQNLSIEELIQAICLFRNVSISGGRTLLFIDEIQNSPQAVSQIRYFYESAKDLHVIAAGSLFEVVIGDQSPAFPVGRVQYLFMYPLTFEEFLAATGEVQALKYYHSLPLPDFAYAKLLKLFHRYTLIGGMPEIVKTYIKKPDIIGLTEIYQGLLTSFQDDVSKYARNTTTAQVIRHAIESAPMEAGKRIKFQGFGNSNYRSREMGEALRMLERAMLIYLLYPSTSTEPPIRPDLRKSPKLQFLDTGLMNYVVGLQEFFFKMEDLQSFYQGLLAEHIVGQELLAADMKTPRKPFFWVREKKQSNAEVDFIVQSGQYIIPVEVKSGKSGTLRSLHQFVDRSNHPFAVRLYAGPADKVQTSTPSGKPYTLLNLPYFLAGKVRDYTEWLKE